MCTFARGESKIAQLDTITHSIYCQGLLTMANTSTFLEPSSFMDVPPLRLVRKEGIALEEIGTFPYNGVSYKTQEHEYGKEIR